MAEVEYYTRIGNRTRLLTTFPIVPYEYLSGEPRELMYYLIDEVSGDILVDMVEVFTIEQSDAGLCIDMDAKVYWDLRTFPDRELYLVWTGFRLDDLVIHICCYRYEMVS